MIDLGSLDPEVRAWAYVGQFLQNWALMEAELHKAIGKALGLSDLQSLVVCKNIQLRDKISILSTAITLIFLPGSSQNRYQKGLDSLAKYSPTRNMFAHDFFTETEGGDAVEFIAVKARGELKFPKEVWGKEEFEAARIKVDQYAEDLKALQAEIEAGAMITKMAALRDAGLPMPWLYGLTGTDPLGPLPLRLHDSPNPDTTFGTEDKSPLRPPEKQREGP